MRLVPETKELCEKIVQREKTDSAAKITSKGREKEQTLVAYELVVALEANLPEAKTVYAQQVIVAAQSSTGVKEG